MNNPASHADSAQNPQVIIERILPARRERVFRAWTDPVLMGKWFTPAPLKPVEIAANPVAGGRYRIGMSQPDGTVHVVAGQYVEVRPPERLVFTWAWQMEPPGPESLVTIDFFELGESTRVVLRHEHLETPELREDHRHGWEGCLDNLQVNISRGEL